MLIILKRRTIPHIKIPSVLSPSPQRQVPHQVNNIPQPAIIPPPVKAHHGVPPSQPVDVLELPRRQRTLPFDGLAEGFAAVAEPDPAQVEFRFVVAPTANPHPVAAVVLVAADGFLEELVLGSFEPGGGFGGCHVRGDNFEAVI